MEETPIEVSEAPVKQEHVEQVKQGIKAAPPVKFDIARQVRVFESYLQYVELSLTGAAIQKRRIQIPKALQNLGSSKDLEGKLKTTFDLIGKSSSLSSHKLEEELHEIRRNFTPSLGKEHGRVVLKAVKSALLDRIAKLQENLDAHQKKVESELQSQLDKSKEDMKDHFLPLVLSNPPDRLIATLPDALRNEDSVRRWIRDQLDHVFPDVKDLTQKMSLEVRFKDVTYETLNREDFLDSVKLAFPSVNWEKPFHDFKAAGESTLSEQSEL